MIHLLRRCREAGGDGRLFDLRYEDGSITGRGDLELEPGDHVHDLSGAFLTGGLVDAHVHLALGGTPVENAALSLAAGVTALRDLGSANGAAGPVGAVSGAVSPRGDRGGGDGRELPVVVPAGRALTVRGSYGAFLGVGVSTRAELLAAAERELTGGARVLKVIMSGSVDFATGTVGAPHFERDDLAATVALAHDRGVAVAAHANGPEAVLRAVEAGVDSVEHGILVDERALEEMSARGTRWVPTLTPLCNLCGDPRWPRLPEVFGGHLAAVARGAEIGVRVIAGSDAGSPGVPHGSLRTELRLLRRVGLGVRDVRAAATTAAAALLGLRGGYGGLEPGSRTDLVWFERDPFAAGGAAEGAEVAGRLLMPRGL